MNRKDRKDREEKKEIGEKQMKRTVHGNVTKWLVERALSEHGLLIARKLINGRRVYRVSDGKEFESLAEIVAHYQLKLRS